MNTMAIGDKLDKKGGLCLIRSTNSCDEVHGTIHA